MKMLKAVGSALVALFTCVAAASAVVVEKKTLDQLVSESPVVVIGVVVGVRYVAPDKSQKPFTQYDLRLFDVVIGKDRLGRGPGETIELLFYGGLDGENVFEAVVGMPELELGETYLLMLRGGEWTVNPVAGWHQGAFRIIGVDANAKALLSLNGDALVGVEKGELQFVRPKAIETRKGGVDDDALRGDQRGAGIKLDGRPAQVKGAAEPPLRQAPVLKLPAPAKSIYREDNVEALEAEDVRRAAAAQPAPKPPMQTAVDALGGRKPFTLDALLAEIRASAARNAGAHAKMTFSLRPSPRPALEPKRPKQ